MLSDEGYLYAFRDRLTDLQTNVSALRENKWIDQHTRAVVIHINLHNPCIQLFTTVVVLIEFLSMGALELHLFIRSTNFYRKVDSFHG